LSLLEIQKDEDLEIGVQFLDDVVYKSSKDGLNLIYGIETSNIIFIEYSERVIISSFAFKNKVVFTDDEYNNVTNVDSTDVKIHISKRFNLLYY